MALFNDVPLLMQLSLKDEARTLGEDREGTVSMQTPHIPPSSPRSAAGLSQSSPEFPLYSAPISIRIYCK